MLDGSAALVRMAPGTKNTASACLYTVWVALGSPHTLGPLAGHTFATATEAYQYTTKRHTDRNPPAGVPVWFGSTAGPRYAGDTHWPDGDVALSVGGGRLFGTDYPTYGHTGECTIAQREAQTGRVYLGWTEDFLGNDVAFATAGVDATALNVPVVPEFDEENDMYLVRRIADGDPTLNGMTCAMGPGFFQHLGAGDIAGVARDLKIPADKIIDGSPEGSDGLPAVEFTRLVSLFQIPPGYVQPGGSYLAAAQSVADIRSAVTQTIARDGQTLSQATDNMNTGTLVRELVTRSNVTAGQVAAAVVAALPASEGLTHDQLVAAVTQALGGLTLKATS